MTINGEHLIADVIRLCGGENVFAKLPVLAPAIDVEAVLAAQPEAIVASGMGEARPEWLDDWRKWSKLTAVARGNLFFIPKRAGCALECGRFNHGQHGFIVPPDK